MGWFGNDQPKLPSLWERIETRDSDYRDERDTARLNVPGGWLVRERVFRTGAGSHPDTCAVSIVFVADQDHAWKISQ